MTGLIPASAEEIERDRNVPFNVTVNILDGAFFGMAFGFASLTAVLPLFISLMTDSAVWIGLIPAMHMVGWYLPQVFTAQGVARSAHFQAAGAEAHGAGACALPGVGGGSLVPAGAGA